MKMNVMKKGLGLLLAGILMTATVTAPAFAADSTSIVKEDPNLLTVNGKGIIKVKADIAYVQIGYEAKNKVATEAQKEARIKMDAILKALKAKGVKDADLKTINISLYKTSDYTKDQKVEYYYIANQTMELTIRDLDKAGTYIDTAADAGSNSIGSIRFTVENQDDYYNDALKLAVKSATSKANAILDVYGIKVTKPSKISETSYNGGVVYATPSVYADKAMAAPPTQVSPGVIEISADVTVEYKY